MTRHRTRDLAPLGASKRFIRRLRYHEASRQVLALLLMVLFALVSEPAALSLLAGIPLIAAGAGLRLAASGFIFKNRQLATQGPYALVRHPLYTGNISIITGFAVVSGVWWTAAAALAFFWFYYPTAIEYEDRKLHKLFGERWERWAREVPALLPSFRNLGAAAAGRWSLEKSARQNGEPLIALLVAACLFYVILQLP